MSNQEQDPAAVSRLDNRADRLYAIYGGRRAQCDHDHRDAIAAARMRREQMAVQAIEAFAAPLVLDNHGRQL